MLELTLAALLNTMAADFCALIETEKDVVKSAFIAYSMANKQYGPDNVIKVVTEANPIELKALAVSSVISKCPNKL